MADQNISQILAALAAQRSATTPLQAQVPPQQQPPYTQAYQPQPYPAPTPPVALQPYGLPQPSSSGSVDLSSIKPSNSGSVSLADAVAKARGFAAQKGFYSPSRDSDPRLAGRNYRRSRSRSRSPPRPGRDSYRDGYNPYRDERRSDLRRDGGAYSRDRSLSPRRTYSPLTGRGFGGPPGNRSPLGRGGGGDDGHETITIESNLVGLIIGRQGENLRRVENETATRVQFLTGPESSGPIRQCKISGTRQARDNAKREIYRIITDNGKELGKTNLAPMSGVKNVGSHAPALRAGEDATQIMVPNRTVGLIIGRGGETIRDLQERSACHVNIVGEEKSVNGLRPVNLIGTPQAAAIARELILEIVESDNKNHGQSNPNTIGNMNMNMNNNNRDGGRGQQNNMYGGGNDNEKINDNITVPSEAVGMIIGKGGETIKDMQQATGCKINVSQPNGRDIERDIGLVGTRGAIEAAKRAIMDKVHTVSEKNRPQQSYNRDNTDRYQPNHNPNRNSPYPQSHPQQSHSQQQSHPQQQQPYPQPQLSPIGAGAGAGAAGVEPQPDPYAAYGGYANYVNYVALCYQSFAGQSQQQQQQQAQAQAQAQSQQGDGAGPS